MEKKFLNVLSLLDKKCVITTSLQKEEQPHLKILYNFRLQTTILQKAELLNYSLKDHV